MEQIKNATHLTLTQSMYDQLVEERLAFQDAGMSAKVIEWDYKIKLAEAGMQYAPTSFTAIVEDLGIKGLNDVLDKRKEYFAKQVYEANEIARSVLGPMLHAKVISESKLWSLLSDSNYRFAKNPLAKSAAIKLMLPKLRGTARIMLEQCLDKQDVPDKDLPEITAYVKMVTIENYKADDNPPMEVLRKIADAVKSRLFNVITIAYPMVGQVKKIDPIVTGYIQNPNKTYPSLGDIDRFWLNGAAPIEYLKSLDFGRMFRIAEWI